MDISFLRTWIGDLVLPFQGGQDSVHRSQDDRDLDHPFPDVQDLGLPSQDDLDWVLPCWDVRDLVHQVPCRDSVLPCQDVMKVPWGCFLGERRGPLEHFHLAGCQGWSHVDCQILVQSGLSFQRKKLALVHPVPFLTWTLCLDPSGLQDPSGRTWTTSAC